MFKIAGIAVVAAWLVMLGVLAEKSGVVGPVLQASHAVIPAGEEWMGIYMEGKKIGYAVDRVKKIPGGYETGEEMMTALSVQGSRQEIRTATVSRVDDSLALKDFTFSLKSGLADMDIKGVVDGSTLKLEISTAGRVMRQEIPITEPPHLSADLELYLKREGLAVGKKFRLPFFDPASLSSQYMEIEVEGMEELKSGDRLIPVYRVKESYAGVVVTAWVSNELGMIKGEGPMGFTFLKETKEQALKKPEGGYEPADIIALTSVPVEGDIPEPRKALYMKAKLTGVELGGFELSGGRQVFKDGVIEVSADGLGGAPVTLPVADPELAEWLKPSSLVQSDDPEIKKKALEITGGERDALKAARKIEEWVYRGLKKQTSAGIPSAVEVLKNLFGDCNEHTTLYTALARSIGLPTKMDAGIVMLGGRFYYHAWPEVYVGRWIAIDPTFGQFPADATHIRLIEGGPDKYVAIIKEVGRLKVEILEHR